MASPVAPLLGLFRRIGDGVAGILERVTGKKRKKNEDDLDDFGIPIVDGIIKGSIESRDAKDEIKRGPSVAERAKVARDYIHANPLFLIVPAGILVFFLVAVLVVIIINTPPAPIQAAVPEVSAGTQEVLDAFIVPYDDPLNPPFPLDRLPKTRYTPSDVAKAWRKLGDIDAKEIRRRNVDELEALFATIP